MPVVNKLSANDVHHTIKVANRIFGLKSRVGCNVFETNDKLWTGIRLVFAAF